MKRIAVLSLVLICCLTCALGEERMVALKASDARLPMYWMPLSSSSVMAYIPNGAMVTVEREEDGWCLVTYERKTGYVRAVYLTGEPSEIGEAYADLPEKTRGSALPLTQNRARDIADVALTRVYPDFLLSEYGVVQVTYREDTPEYGTYYGFEYFCADGSASYRCYVDAFTGGIVKLLPPGR